MIVEERDYTLKPGKFAAFVETYRERGLLNILRRKQAPQSLLRMLADPRSQAYLVMVGDLLQRQTTRILSPVSFSPLR